MDVIKYLSKGELQSGFYLIKQSPDNDGEVQMIVRRPETDKREILEEGELDLELGLVGDRWGKGIKMRKNDLNEYFNRQITIMNSRTAALVAGNRDRWPLAGDQLYIDLNISSDNLPPGTRLAIGSSIVEVTDLPHNGCDKFKKRYGLDALKFVNSREGKKYHLRGINTRIIRGGIVRVGDKAIKL